MPIEARQCPCCGAPLHVTDNRSATVCVYCNSALVVTRDAAGRDELRKDAAIDEQTVAHINSMLLAGQREQAILLFDQTTGRGRAAATEAIDEYASHVVRNLRRNFTYNPLGFVMLLGALALVVGSVWVIIVFPWWLWPFALVGLLFGGGHLYRGVPVALRTLRYLGATIGEARVVRHAYIGCIGDLYSYLLLLEVRGPDGASFQTELPFPVAESGRAKIREGLVVLVKYFPGDPGSVIFYRHRPDPEAGARPGAT